jgi:protein subunit release factor B
MDRGRLEKECEVTFLVAGGPGGQHRNKRETGVRLRHLPTGTVVMATERRSQAQNLEAAFERMEKKLLAKSRRPKPRKPTKPTKASVEERLRSKKMRSGIKRGRGGLDDG